MEAVTLHDTGGALPLVHARESTMSATAKTSVVSSWPSVYSLALLVRSSSRWRRGVTPAFLEVTGVRLVDRGRLHGAEAELYGGVAVLLRRTDLREHCKDRPGSLSRGRRGCSRPYLGHAELGARSPFHNCVRASSSVASRELDLDVDTRRKVESHERVDGLRRGSRMSISRLCVRISKCSRLSLYLWGERITQVHVLLGRSARGGDLCARPGHGVHDFARRESMTSWSYALSLMRIFCPATVHPSRPAPARSRMVPGDSR